MGFFEEGHDPLDRPGINPPGRMPVTQQQIDQAQKSWNQQHAGDAAAMYLSVVLAVAAVLAVAYGLYRIRGSVLTVADQIAVAGAAKGVRAARKLQARKRAFAERVVVKADETQP